MSDDPLRDKLAQLLRDEQLTTAEFSGLSARLSPAVSPGRPLLRRSRRDRWLGGVCGGLAARFGCETWIVRLLTVLTLFWFGSGIVLYLLAWFFVPREATPVAVPSSTSSAAPTPC